MRNGSTHPEAMRRSMISRTRRPSRQIDMDSVRREMESLTKMLQFAFAKYKFCDRNFGVNVVTTRDHVESIRSDLESKKIFARGLHQQYVEMLNTFCERLAIYESQKLLVDPDGLLESSTNNDIGSINYFQNPENASPEWKLGKYRFNLKSIIQTMNYLLDMYRLIFPEIQIMDLPL
ncbi:hypothetical protein RF11_05513 [Thelohanellus kitauei]|uniref:Uncharacterized protein n=1 Tax=Thelohanellus kitauei TaxID=669202 RepID=A0A0C2J6F6_THEKT|nr:hypothetical protein RF11_05513 [Thelohanellus kitauei]